MKHEFIDYDKLRLNLVEVLEEIDKVLAQVALPRDRSLAFHVALVQVVTKLKEPDATRS